MTKKKAVQKLTQKNKAFWAKSKSEQRIAVAKDVLKQLHSGFLIPETGIYVGIGKLPTNEMTANPQLDKLFSELKKTGVKCEVCGIGAAFVSMVELGNNKKTTKYFTDFIESHDQINANEMRKALRKVFSPNQLSLIECAFETSENHADDKSTISYNERLMATEFGQHFGSPKERLIAIMENIISNKGTFIP